MTKISLKISIISMLIVMMGGVGCSSNHTKKPSATNKSSSASKSAKLARMEWRYKADQALIAKAMKSLQKEERAGVIAKKKAWIATRRKQQAAKRKELLKIRKQQLAVERKRRAAKNKYAYKSPRSPATRKVSWRSNHHYALSGDFARNSSAKSFIRQMSNSHNMDSNYLNRIFTQARNLKLVYTPPRKPRSRSYGRMGRWTRYRRFFITPRHINGGVAFWKQHAATLNKAYRQYGVPPEYIVGILGVETIYGGNVGKTRVIDSLSTKAFSRGRRQKFFRNELEKFLLMAQSEGLSPTSLMGSSAGAVGLCQFMPSNFKSLGVDYNRNGSCNLWDPTDAIGSVANYFSRHGWRRGGPVAVRASTQGKAHRGLTSGYKKTYSLNRLANKGVRPQGRMDSTVRFLRMNTNAGDEIWLGGHNFYVITRYNHSSMYALAVHQLAQEVKGRYQGRIRVASK